MNEQLKITYLVNAGLQLQLPGCRLLLDALEKAEDTDFNGLSEELWQKLQKNAPGFPPADWLVYTHLHPDHYHEKLTADYLSTHPGCRLAMPEPEKPLSCALPAGSRLFEPQKLFYRLQLAPDIHLTACRMRHLDVLYHQVPHWVLMLEAGSGRFLFTGDLDYTHETLKEFADLSFTAIFITPLFFHALACGRFFTGKIQTQQLVIYHLPEERSDQTGLCQLLRKDLLNWKSKERIIPLWEEGQELNYSI